MQIPFTLMQSNLSVPVFWLLGLVSGERVLGADEQRLVLSGVRDCSKGLMRGQASGVWQEAGRPQVGSIVRDLSRGRGTLGGFWRGQLGGKRSHSRVSPGAEYARGRGWHSGLPLGSQSRRSWSSVKSCYRPVSPARRTTAWIGETVASRLSEEIPGFLPPSLPRGPLSEGSRVLMVPGLGMPACLCSAPRGPWERHMLLGPHLPCSPLPLLCPLLFQ